jgi:hypothetical protein
VGEHPRDHVRRLELLNDAELDGFRAAHGEVAERAFDLAVELETTLETRLSELGLAVKLGKMATRPTLAVFVCTKCGASEVGTVVRSGVLARAIDRSKLAERDLLRVEVLLAEAWAPDAPPPLDRLPASTLMELLALASADADLETVRRQVEPVVERSVEG